MWWFADWYASLWRMLFPESKPPPGSFLSEDQIVDTVYNRLTDADIQALRGYMSKGSLIELHHFTGRQIRNEFKLWFHPLADSEDGWSPMHPDNWSMRIIERVWARVIDHYGKKV